MGQKFQEKKKKKKQGTVVYNRDQEMRLVRLLYHCVQIHVGEEDFN